MGAQFQPLSGQRLLNQHVRDQLGECTLGPKRSGTVSECYALKHHVKEGEERLGPHLFAHDSKMLQVWYCASRAPLRILNLPFVLLHGAQDGLSAPSLPSRSI
ncbi:hypothetical protein DPX16_22811 [Anabarilius grahami]|uniref:Uncharacterized protein n=1 Tax=Anabarilius grahami TaxID=495550 RepID=A0A3N0ZA75_ANAGA|nr:hypothetical protein DPX16_22811 [Anabarilius grahami]